MSQGESTTKKQSFDTTLSTFITILALFLEQDEEHGDGILP